MYRDMSRKTFIPLRKRPDYCRMSKGNTVEEIINKNFTKVLSNHLQAFALFRENKKAKNFHSRGS